MRLWERLVRATKAYLSPRFLTGTYWVWAFPLTLCRSEAERRWDIKMKRRQQEGEEVVNGSLEGS